MSRQGIFTGFSPNDGTGDSLASGAVKVNANFEEIYNLFGDGNNLSPITYVNSSGISSTATYATSAGISTLSQGITGSPNVTLGSVTASSFTGSGAGLTSIPSSQLVGALPAIDGSALTGIVASGSGVVVSEEGTPVGTAGTINFLGIGVTATVSGGIANVEITSGSSLTVKEVASQGGVANVTVNNVSEIQFNNGSGFNVSDEGGGTAFVDLGSTFNPWYVNGEQTLSATGEEPIEFIAGPGIAITTKAVASVGIGTTFSKAITFTSTGISDVLSDPSPQLGGDLDLNNNNITGTGNINVSGVTTASSFVKDGGTSSEFLKADGSVDTNTYLTSYTETQTLNDVLGLGNNSSLGINITGVVTATGFVGDGSGLTGVTATGSGIEIRDSGTPVGTASTVDFGTNLTVSPVSAGVVTVTASGGGGTSYWVSTAAGIHTLSNVGVGTTNPTSTLSVDGTVNVTGLSTFNDELRVSNVDSNLRLGLKSNQFSNQLELRHYDATGSSYIYHTGSGTFHISMEQSIGEKIQFDTISEVMCQMIPNGPVNLYYDGSKKFETTNEGVVVTGILTATSFVGDGSGLTNLPGPQTGIGTFDAIVGASNIIDSFNIATENISIIEYNVFVNNGGNRIQSQKALIMLGDEAYSEEYAIMYSANHLVSVGATISGGICNVTVTPSSGVSGLTTFKFSKGGSV